MLLSLTIRTPLLERQGEIQCHKQCIMTKVRITVYPIHIKHFKQTLLIMVGTQSKECTVFRWSNNGIVGSKPTRGRDVSECFSVSVLYVGSGLAMGQTIAQAVLPNVAVSTFVLCLYPIPVFKNCISAATTEQYLSACRIRAQL